MTPIPGTTIVSGGSSGIGKAVVEGLLDRGRPVAILDIERPPDEMLAGAQVLFVECDVADPAGVHDAVAEIASRVTRIDGLAACAGIGGEAALAVGRALSSLAPAHQVLVVTHLPQVAAFAHHQVTVRKTDDGATVASDVVAVTGGERISELARMLSGQPDLASGRQHATELLASAASLRPRTDSPNGATAGDSGVASPSQASPVAAP